jgi:hypothetical protein
VLKELIVTPDILRLIVRGLNGEERVMMLRDLETHLLGEEVIIAKKAIQSALSSEEWTSLQTKE